MYSKEDTRYENSYTISGKFVETVCTVCGDKFKSVNGRALYCSDRCKNDAYMAWRKEEKIIERNKVCVICNKPFIASRKDSKYCSNACKQKQYRIVTVSSSADISRT